MTSGIFIDGGYIGEIAKNFGIRVNLEKLRDYICGKSQLYRTYYYHCMPFQDANPSPDQSARYSKANKFIEKLKLIKDFEVKLGRLQRVYDEYGKPHYNQKMVDVMLAVDLVKLSIERTITRAIVLAGDSDFVYAIEIAKQSGVDVELHYSSPPYINDQLFQVVSERKLITKQILEKCRLF